MFDATKLLGSLLEGRPTASMPGRVGAAVQQGASGGLLEQVMSQFGSSSSGGGLGGLLGSVLGGSSNQQATASNGMLADLTAMARRAATSPGQELAQNNPAAIGGLGALAGALLGGGKGAVGGGLMAVLGSLAFSALQKTAAPDTRPDQGLPANAIAPKYGSLAEIPGYTDPIEIQRKARLLFRAMIQAAKADGHVDADEASRLQKHLDSVGEGQEAQAFVQNEIGRPLDVAGLARDVKSRQEAIEVYAASIMAIDVDTVAERDYLAALAKALLLPASAVTQVHSSLGVAV